MGIGLNLRQKIAIKRMYYRLVDRLADLSGRDRPLLPPSHLRPYVGPGDYFQIGQAARELLISKAHLKPDSRMLDIGCGPGRIALALMDYIGSSGEYQGFDVMTESLDWAKANITTRKPNFQFDWINVYNKFYNPRGTSAAKEYVFPREDNYYDVVFCGSLFTHMLPQDTDQYLSEISRMMKPGGYTIATFFLINDDVEQKLAIGKTDFSTDHECEGARVFSEELPEYITAQYEGEVRRSLDKHGLEICNDIYYGSWSGAEDSLSSQDVIVLTKPIA